MASCEHEKTCHAMRGKGAGVGCLSLRTGMQLLEPLDCMPCRSNEGAGVGCLSLQSALRGAETTRL